MRREDIVKLLFATPYAALQQRAAAVCAREKGTHVFVRGLVEFSNVCRCVCCYCGLRAPNTRLERYTLPRAQILAAAADAACAGADTIVLQSGEYAVEPLWLADMISDIRRDLGVAVTLSLGVQPERACALWLEAGATRYLLKHETADAHLYAALHPGQTLRQRLACLRMLVRLGYAVGSGFMVGLPGHRVERLADDILLARRLKVAMCGAGPFLPQAHTPLHGSIAGSTELTLRVMAVLRLALPWANIPATTALATQCRDGQKEGLLAGGNVLMPSFTPARYREHYRLYDHKKSVTMAEVRRIVTEAGRTHSLPLGKKILVRRPIHIDTTRHGLPPSATGRAAKAAHIPVIHGR